MEAIAPTKFITTLISKRHYPPTTPQFLNFTTPKNLHKPRNKNIHCSTKSNTNKENTTNENQLSSQTTITQIQATPTSNQSINPTSPSLSRGLIFDLGPETSWDSHKIGSPVVKRFLSDDEERWYMWYHGSSTNESSDSIGLAVSSNGIHWERGIGGVNSSSDVGLVMKCNEDWWAFDIRSVRPCEMVIMSSAKVRVNSAVYWLYYTGFSGEKIESLRDFDENGGKGETFTAEKIESLPDFDENGAKGETFSAEKIESLRDFDENGGKGEIFKSLPGLAMSQDGRHWARIEGEHHSGALFDVGSEGEWDSLFIASPQVVFHGSGDIRMYYHSFDVENGHFAVGMARSRDGMKWVKLGKILGGGGEGAFDERGMVNARVLLNKKDGKYLMVYEGVGGNGRRSIGVAESVDGLKDWRRVGDCPVFEGSTEGGWDSEGVGMPCLVHMDGDTNEWRLYYRGIGKEGRSGIGLAVSKESEVNNFERWTGFHL